nr:uncharacterized protein LOC113711214 [Coffea arabica]
MVELYDRQKDKVESTNQPKLYRAAMEGNWKDAKAIFDIDRKAKTRKISNLGMTALHVAASCGQSEFVVEMVKKLSKKQLEGRDTHGCTALQMWGLPKQWWRRTQICLTLGKPITHLLLNGDIPQTTRKWWIISTKLLRTKNLVIPSRVIHLLISLWQSFLRGPMIQL